MGSVINCFFPRAVSQDEESVRRRLNETFATLDEEIGAIRAWSRAPLGTGGWSIWTVQAEADEPMEVEGEGPCGFMVGVYDRTVCFTNVAKFGAIAYPEFGIAQPLRAVFRKVASELGLSGPYAIAPGGYGETDRARDLAYYEAAPFELVCERLEQDNGPPARSWGPMEAGQVSWYLDGSGQTA